ncbi:MAG TPA: hypothetical protein VFB66_21015 [Tepidisphaeraceae bacterium]|nr:hypothetical protein [Tepidisphaeraceae bacterium]
MHPSFQPLLDSLSTLEFEEFGSLALTAVTWAGNDAALHLVVRQPDRPDEPWRLDCEAMRDSRIVCEPTFHDLWIETEHPLLLPHAEPAAELYFSSRPADPGAAVAELIDAHRAVVGEWFDCTHFFNLGPYGSLRRMLEGGHGKLAAGPLPLIERYADVLRRAGVKVSSPPARPPVWWDGVNWVPQSIPLYALILGQSFVLSPILTAERM